MRSPAVSSAGALVDALHALGARRIGLVTPYLKGLTRLVEWWSAHRGDGRFEPVETPLARTA